MDKIRYGIISTASIVPRFIEAVKEVGNGDILAIASRDINKAKEKAEEYQIPKYYGNYEELFQDEDVNVVYIATINSLHYDNCLDALNHNKNVICEKPFTLTKREAEHLFDLAREKGLFIMEAQKAVFLPLMSRIKKIIEDGDIGKVGLLDFTSSFLPTYNSWISSKSAGGGTLFGNASYFIQICKYLFGEEKILDVNGTSIISPHGADSQSIINLKLSKDILVTSKISFDVLAVNKAMIYGESGYIKIPDYWKARKATMVWHDGKTSEINIPQDNELVYEIQHIEECLEKGLLESPIMDREMTVSTIELLEGLSKEWYRN